MGDTSPPGSYFPPLCATKGSLVNLNYGDPNNPYTGRLALYEDPAGFAPLMEHGIFKNGTNLYYNQATAVYRFALIVVYLPISSTGN